MNKVAFLDGYMSKEAGGALGHIDRDRVMRLLHERRRELADAYEFQEEKRKEFLRSKAQHLLDKASAPPRHAPTLVGPPPGPPQYAPTFAGPGIKPPLGTVY